MKKDKELFGWCSICFVSGLLVGLMFYGGLTKKNFTLEDLSESVDETAKIGEEYCDWQKQMIVNTYLEEKMFEEWEISNLRDYCYERKGHNSTFSKDVLKYVCRLEGVRID